MPAVMGMMGPVWKKLSGEIHSRYMKNSTIGRKILPRVTNPEGTFYNVRKGGGRMVGQGTTGSAFYEYGGCSYNIKRWKSTPVLERCF